MGVYLLDFSDCSRVLQLGKSLLFNSEYNTVCALDTNSGGASIDCLEGVLDLEEVAIRCEYCDCLVVGCHSVYLLFKILIYISKTD